MYNKGGQGKERNEKIKQQNGEDGKKRREKAPDGP